MELQVEPGKYVIAVSGGVDSMALLHMLWRQQHQTSPFSQIHIPLTLVVAHFDHGIRHDSAEDRKLVQAVARQYGLPFVHTRAELGPHASEATARQARYDFLHSVRRASGAGAIITAHHEDDVVETLVMNLIRGTNRRGLNSLKSTDIVKRPLLQVPKKELLRYAEREGLRWREDSTNSDEKYLRNYIRHHILPRFAEADREALLEISRRAGDINRELLEQTSNYLHVQPGAMTLDRHGFIMLPHAVAREVMAEWLLNHTGVELSRKLLERLAVAAKTGKAGSKVDIDRGHWLEITQRTLALKPRER